MTFFKASLILMATCAITIWRSCGAFANPCRSCIMVRQIDQSLAATADVESDLAKLGLTPVLEGYVKGLRNVPDDKLRYQQLFFLASKCKPMDPALKTDEIKVPGCLSTVHIHATREDDKIYYVGDSDAQMTKGLVAMLVNGLSGHTNAEIQQVQPEFIKFAGIGSTLTPGRNNGFLNMMKVMKDKAHALVAGGDDSGDGGIATSSIR